MAGGHLGKKCSIDGKAVDGKNGPEHLETFEGKKDKGEVMS